MHAAGQPATTTGTSPGTAPQNTTWNAHGPRAAAPVSRGQHPVTAGWEQRLAAAQAHTRRTALTHWDDYLRRARATAPGRRTDAQRALLALAGVTP